MRKILIAGAIIVMAVSSSANPNNQALPFPVYLNHFFLVIDAPTYADIEKSEFLRKEFAPNEARTTKRTDITYTGLYFYGVNTYFEFFDASKETSRKLGDTGIAFGVEEEGASKILQARLQTSNPNKITRPFNDQQVNWFYMLAPKNSSFASGNNIFIMEYLPTFLSEWHPQADNSRGISRQQILKRYLAVLKARPPNPVFQDVIALTVALDKATTTQIIETCKLFDYQLRAENDATILERNDFTLRVVSETAAARGIQQITMRVNRVPNQKAYRFGEKSVLKFLDNQTATWSF